MAKKVYNFNDILKSRSLYDETKKQLSNELLDNFKLRKDPAIVVIGDDTLEVTVGYVMVNLFMINSFVESGLDITKDDLYNSPTVTQASLRSYFDAILEKFKKSGLKNFDKVRYSIYDTLNEMSDASGKYNHLRGNGISFTDFVRLAVDDPEAHALFNPTIKEGQYNYIEKQFKEYGKKSRDYFSSHETTELYPYAASETGLNVKQLTQAINFIGLKPDVTGNVIPVTVSDNFLNGRKSLESYYINAKGTRLALITNNKFVRKSGLNLVS